MCRVLKVTGESLVPFVDEGDFVLVFKIPFFLLKEGNIIVFHQSTFGTLIKLVETVHQEDKSVFVVGTHPSSTDSRIFGPVAGRDIIGKVVWRIKARK